ncbi:MAG: hypothetical protein Q7R83_00805 [bacterium]|nr:hypothetical protein [bacterium]
MSKPSQEMSTAAAMPDQPNPDKRDARVDKLLQKKHDIAVAALATEKILSIAVDALLEKRWAPSAIEEILQQSTHDTFPTLPAKTKKALTDALRKYIVSVEKARDDKERVQRAFAMHQLTDGARVGKTVGDFVFFQRTGKWPQGPVVFERLEGYLFLICTSFADFLQVSADKKNPVDAAHVGSFHASFSLESSQRLSNVILIDGSASLLSGFPIEQIMAHERQHFFNHKIFSLFKNIEPRPSMRKTPSLRLRDVPRELVQFNKELNHEHALAELKDEVLAYIREGNEGVNRLDNLVTVDGYAHLRKPFHDEETQKVKILIRRTMTAFHLSRAIWNFTPYEWGLVVYQLLDVPLERFPEWIRELDRFYASKGAGRSSQNPLP